MWPAAVDIVVRVLGVLGFKRSSLESACSPHIACSTTQGNTGKWGGGELLVMSG